MRCTVLHPFTFPRDGRTEHATEGAEVDIPADQVAALARAGWVEPEEPVAAPAKPARRRR